MNTAHFNRYSYIYELNIENSTMFSSQNSDLILFVFSDKRTVFTLNDIAVLIGESDFKKLNERLILCTQR